MSTDINSVSDKAQRRRNYTGRGMSSGIYGFAFIGALIYYIQHATTLWMGILGFFKAVVWPAILVYKVMEFLKM